LVMQFHFYELNNLPNMIIQIQGQDFDLGSFDMEVTEEYQHGYLADIWASVEGIPGSLITNNVTLVIPARWYPVGRISVSFSDGVGIDNFSLDVVCSESLEAVEQYGPGWTPAPSMAPSVQPSASPSAIPTVQPSSMPSSTPSGEPSSKPSASPSQQPSDMPSVSPSSAPSTTPSVSPSDVPSATPSVSPSSIPSSLPSAAPSAVPSTSPTAMPSSTESAFPSATPSSTPSSDCILDIEYSTQEFNYEPVSVLWRDEDSVTIGISQSWSDKELCLVGTLYESIEENTKVCETNGQVPPGEFAYHKVKCIDGHADVKIFLQDAMFSTYESVEAVPEKCEVIHAGFIEGAATVSYDVSIPCVAEAECPYPSQTICEGNDDMQIVPTIGFENEEAKTWWYGREVNAPDLSTYLVAKDAITTKTFDVPVDASALTLHFSFYEETDLVPLIIGIQGQEFVLGDFFKDQAESYQEGFLGDVYTLLESTGLNSNNATFVIPARWYQAGRLTVAFGQNVGIDNFGLDAVCGPSPEILSFETEPPTSSPTADCIPNVVYTSSGSADLNYLPIKILAADTDTVTISVSQVWSDEPVCLISTDYVSAETQEEACDTQANVPSGEFAYYKALCEDGFATVTMFVQDSLFADESLSSVPDICQPLEAGPNTISYQAVIPCGSESPNCPPIQSMSCDGNEVMAIVSESYQISANDMWMFSSTDSSQTHGAYILAENGEMTRSFDVPTDASELTVQFTFHELDNIDSMHVRVQVCSMELFLQCS